MSYYTGLHLLSFSMRRFLPITPIHAPCGVPEGCEPFAYPQRADRTQVIPPGPICSRNVSVQEVQGARSNPAVSTLDCQIC